MKPSAAKLNRQNEQNLEKLSKKLSVVLKGYKCRRIYNRNKMILKYRYEYRDLIIYAYNLKHEIRSLKRNESLKKM